MPILASQNLKKYNMFNMMEFKIEDITDESVKVTDIWFKMDKFKACLIPAFCITVYKISRLHSPYSLQCMGCYFCSSS